MSFDYTSGNPANLVGGQPASMADIQGPLTDIRTFLNARIAGIPTLVSSLPVSPVDGQEIYYLADASNGVVWHLRYRSASGSTYKWERVGGAPLYSEVAAAETSAATSFGDLTTAGPQITVPLAGDYLISASAQAGAAGAVVFNTLAAVKIGAASAADADRLIQVGDDASGNGVNIGGSTLRRTGIAAATVLKLQYRVTVGSGSASWSQRVLTVRPVRVG